VGNQAAGEAVATLESLGTERKPTTEPTQARRKLLGALGQQATLQIDKKVGG
jgi:hypothetical protein